MRFSNSLSPAVIVALGFVATSSGSLFHLPPLATLGFTTWLFGFLVILCRSIFKRVPQRDLRIFLAGITIFSSLTFATLSTYFTIGVTTHSTLLLLLVMTMVLVLLGKNTKPFSVPTLSFHNLLALSGNERLVLAGTIFSQATVLLLLILSRYDGALITPWMIFPPTIFAFFFIGTAGVLALQRQTNTAWIWLACSQTFLAVAVSCFVYGVGFGFDPFIHRAAETALINDGFIYPQRFLYSGQYALIGSLHFLTRLPINLIDIWILPLLASIFLPWSAYLGLRDGWKLPEPAARFGWALALFIPFMLFTFTVPFTFTYVIYAGALFLAPLTHTRIASLVILLLASVSCLFHPLLGAPTLILLAASYLYLRQITVSRKILVLILFFIANAIALPLLLAIYQHSNGVRIDLGALIANVHGFKILFANPFPGYSPLIKFSYHLIYWHRYWQPVFGIVVAAIASLFLAKRYPSTIPWLIFILSTLATIYLTSTLFVYKDIIAHEQHEFALRLLQSLYLGAAPILALLISPLLRRYALAIPLLAATITLSWYFSYPQYNAKAASYSPSVSAADIAAVHTIEAMSGGDDYLVLSNQMTSAAALQEFGFAAYHNFEGESVLWYAIPTGGKLYPYYTDLIYSGSTDPIEALFEKTDIDRIYVVIHTYWPWSTDFIDQLKVECEQYQLIQRDIHLFEFVRYAEGNQNESDN